MKQFDLLAGRPVVEWSVCAARDVATGVVLVLPAGHDDRPSAPQGLAAYGADRVVGGGATRSDSVRRGLEAVPATAEIVVVHDAARPLASPGLFRAVVEPLLSAPAGADAVDAVVCALPVPDTVKRLAPDGATVVATVDRSDLVTVQTPQAFRAAVLRRAHATDGQATDDAALVEAAGGVVRVVAGERANVKLTVPEDLAFAELVVLEVRAVGKVR